MDKKLIVFLLSTSSILIVCGSVMIALYLVYFNEYKHVRPNIVIGPVLIGAGLMAIMLSSEICWRYYKANKRELDPELDNLTNPQEVKHWIDPKIIPYGWGSFDQKQFEGSGQTKDVSCVILPLLSSEPG